MLCYVFFMTVDRTWHVYNGSYTEGQHLPYVYAYDSLHRVVVVSCGDVYTESCFAGVDTVQAQGWSVVEREQAVVELEAATKFAENVGPLNMHRACFPDEHRE